MGVLHLPPQLMVLMGMAKSMHIRSQLQSDSENTTKMQNLSPVYTVTFSIKTHALHCVSATVFERLHIQFRQDASTISQIGVVLTCLRTWNKNVCS